MSGIKFCIAKGRYLEQIKGLLENIFPNVRHSYGELRVHTDDPDTLIKILRAQDIPKLVEMGSFDLGLTGEEWVIEYDSQVVLLQKLGYVKVVMCAIVSNNCEAKNIHEFARIFNRKKIRAASPYENITRRYLEKHELQYAFFKCHGSTEAYPPEDADMVIDCVETGNTLIKNELKLIDTIMTCSAVLIANRGSVLDSSKIGKIKRIQNAFSS